MRQQTALLAMGAVTALCAALTSWLLLRGSLPAWGGASGARGLDAATLHITHPWDGMVVSRPVVEVRAALSIDPALATRIIAEGYQLCAVPRSGLASATCLRIDEARSLEVSGLAAGEETIDVMLVSPAGAPVDGARRSVTIRYVDLSTPPPAASSPASDLRAHQVPQLVITGPEPGSVFAEEYEGVHVLYTLVFELDGQTHTPPPGSRIAVQFAGMDPVLLDADNEVHITMQRRGTAAVRMGVVQWGRHNVVAELGMSPWHLIDTRALDIGCGATPPGWTGLAQTLGPARLPVGRPLKVSVVGTQRSFSGQALFSLQQLRAMQRGGGFDTAFVDLGCVQPHEKHPEVVRQATAAGAALVDICFETPTQLLEDPDWYKRVIAARSWGEVEPMAQRMLGGLYAHLQGVDVFVMANSDSLDLEYCVAVARLAGVRAVVADLGGFGPEARFQNTADVTALLTSSHFVAEHPRVKAHGLPTFVVNPTVDTSVFFPQGPRCIEPDREGGRRTIGMLGRLSPEKNPGLFVSAAAELHRRNPLGYRFAMMGEGPLDDPLFEEALRLGVPLTLLGAVDHESLPCFLRSLDALVCPSLQQETFGLANIEAMAVGVPVVAWPYAGMRGYIRDGETAVVPAAYTVGALADAMARAAAGVPEVTQRARAFVEARMDDAQGAAHLRALFAHVASGAP